MGVTPMGKAFGKYENSRPPWDICPQGGLCSFVLMVMVIPLLFLDSA